MDRNMADRKKGRRKRRRKEEDYIMEGGGEGPMRSEVIPISAGLQSDCMHGQRKRAHWRYFFA